MPVSGALLGAVLALASSVVAAAAPPSADTPNLTNATPAPAFLELAAKHHSDFRLASPRTDN